MVMFTFGRVHHFSIRSLQLISPFVSDFFQGKTNGVGLLQKIFLASYSLSVNRGQTSNNINPNNSKKNIKIENIDLFSSEHQKNLVQISSCLKLIPNFIDDEEEAHLLEEAEKVLKSIRYEQSHWDDAIHNYRETEYLNWNKRNAKIIERVRQEAFTQNDKLIKFVHILDIASDGFIKSHVDSVRFCGDTIAGISLLSDSVMRLRLEENREIYVDILLNRRSLYIMTGDSRYNYAHEILDNKNSYFDGRHVKRDRRISIICRNEPCK